MKICTGNDWGVARNDKHMVVETENPRVVFSFTQKGESISAHFAIRNIGKNALIGAINEFCQWTFESMPWCKMILAVVDRRVIGKVIERCGFFSCGKGMFNRDGVEQIALIYMRPRT